MIYVVRTAMPMPMGDDSTGEPPTTNFETLNSTDKMVYLRFIFD